MTSSSRKVICIDARMLFSSGIGTVIQNVIRRLPLEPVAWTIIVADERAARWVKAWQPSARLVLSSSPIYSLSEQISLPWAARKADLFWSPHYNIPLLFPGKIIATVHDVLHLARPDFFPGVIKQAYARLLLHGVNLRCPKILCVSQFTATEIRRLIGVPASRIQVMPNGVDPIWFESVSICQRDKPYFIYVGNLKPHKNLLRLLQAFEQVMGKIPHNLIIVGQRDGFITGDPRVESYASRLGDRVQFTGWLDEARLRQLVAQATALVFPSLYEGFGLPVLEAMACGCPVVCSSAASLPEVGGSVPVYFDPESVDEMAHALLQAATWSGEERNRLIKAGTERAALFSWDQSVERLLQVFKETLA